MRFTVVGKNETIMKEYLAPNLMKVKHHEWGYYYA